MIELLKNQTIIKVSGKDAAKLLNSLTTNDVVNNTYSYTYLLNNQGKYLFDFFVFKENDESFLLECHAARSEELIRLINFYKLRSEVTVADSKDSLSVIYSHEDVDHDYLASNFDPRYKKLGKRTIIKTQNINDLKNKVSNIYAEDKYKYAIPDGQVDLLQEKSIPIEYGAEELGAISYTKGCYVGQEVISRAKYQGVVRKKIYHLAAKDNKDIPFLPCGSEIQDAEGNKIGIFCSSYKNQGIALLREEKFLALEDKIAKVGEVIAEITVPVWRL